MERSSKASNERGSSGGAVNDKEDAQIKRCSHASFVNKLEVVVADAEEMKEIRKGVKNNKQEVVGWLSKVDPWVRLRLNEQLT